MIQKEFDVSITCGKRSMVGDVYVWWRKIYTDSIILQEILYWGIYYAMS